MRFLSTTILTLCLVYEVGAQTPKAPAKSQVSVVAGNVFVDIAGQRRQLTNLGRDHDPALSPDGKFIVFTRTNGNSPPDALSECKTEPAGDQLRRIDVDGRNDRLLLAAHAGTEPPQQLCQFDQKQFTSDGRKLFFISPAWATSGALHVYDFAEKRPTFVAPANVVIVLSFCDGDHRDQLVLNQHRYFLGGGSYDWFWLYDRTGSKEIGPVGDDSESPESIVEKARDMICAR